MPQWAGSCWYYLRFLDARNDKAAWGKETEKYWMPVDLYVGGAEHAVLHLLYARFWHKVLYDIGVVFCVPVRHRNERPFNRVVVSSHVPCVIEHHKKRQLYIHSPPPFASWVVWAGFIDRHALQVTDSHLFRRRSGGAGVP